MDDKTPPPAPDYTALAQRYLELWQDQVAKLAKDPHDLTAMTAAWTKMAASMTPPTTPPPGAPGHDAGPHRPAPAPAPHGDGGVDRAGGPGGSDSGTDRRLAALEQRVAVLESRIAALAPSEHTNSKQAKSRAASGGRGPRKKS